MFRYILDFIMEIKNDASRTTTHEEVYAQKNNTNGDIVLFGAKPLRSWHEQRPSNENRSRGWQSVGKTDFRQI